MSDMHYWWVTASKQNPDHGWHWDQFFKNPSDLKESFDWGGPKWIRSVVSFARIREMQKGDVVCAYQAGTGIVGFAKLDSNGYPHADSDNYDSFDLAATPVARLQSPIPYDIIRELPEARTKFEFVRMVKQGTVYRISPEGYNDLIRIARQLNPEQIERLAPFGLQT